MCGEDEQKQSTTTSVPDYVESGSKLAVNKATDLVKTPYKPYTGDRVADFNADQQSGFDAVRGLVTTNPGAVGASQYAAAPAQNISTERVVDESGKLGAISEYFNPYVDQALQPALRKIMEAADAQRKRIGAGATTAGAYGDARHGIMEAELDGNTSQAIGDTASQFFASAFDKAMGLRSDDLNRFMNVDTLNANFAEKGLDRLLTGTGEEQTRKLQAIQALLATGALQQGNDQKAMDAQYEEFLREYGHDKDMVALLTQVLGGTPYAKTQTTTTTQPDNSLAGLGGAIAGGFAGTEKGAGAIAALLAGI